MDIKERMGCFIGEMLREYKLTQDALASMLGINKSRLSKYLNKKETPRIEIIMRLAEIGGVTLDELLKTNKSPEKKEIVVNLSGSSKINGVGGGVFYGPIYQNTTIKPTYNYTYEKGDLTEEQAAEIRDLVNDIVEKEKLAKQKPKSHAAVYNSLKKRFKVAYYRKIGEDNFKKVKAYLENWRGRLKDAPAFPRKDPEEHRKTMYRDIFGIARGELGLNAKEAKNYIYDRYKISSLDDLTNDELAKLRRHMHSKKRNKRESHQADD